MKNKPQKPRESLQQAFPEVARQWHPTKNHPETPATVFPHSGKKKWWLCPTDTSHVWDARVCDRVLGRGCPYCSGKRKVNRYYGMLDEVFPQIAEEWHATKNGELKPSLVKPNSKKNVHWQCSSNPKHEWESTVLKRTTFSSPCPFCGGKRFSEENSLEAKHPALVNSWDFDKNGIRTPANTLFNSKERYWWRCLEFPEIHEWQSTIQIALKSENHCKICAVEKMKKLPMLSDYPELAAEWHSERNGELKPENVSASSRNVHWWKCSKDSSHEWPARVWNRVRKGTGCSQCFKNVPSDNSLAALYPKIASEWHPEKNDIGPESVTPSSRKKVWWKCSKNPSHEWQDEIYLRTKRNYGCRGCKKLSLSFEETYPDIAAEWHPTKNGTTRPSDVKQGSSVKYWWKCPVNATHEWEASPQNRGLNSSKCPHCYREKAGGYFSDFLVGALKNGSLHYSIFRDGIKYVQKLINLKMEARDLKRQQLKMLFSYTITLMEAYLSDTFIDALDTRPYLKRTLVVEDPYFKKQKFDLSELYLRLESIDSVISEYLQELMWHNVFKVKLLYKQVLDVDFPDNLAAIARLVDTRHDLVHRNGKTKEGQSIPIRERDVRDAAKLMLGFIVHVEKQLLRPKHV